MGIQSDVRLFDELVPIYNDWIVALGLEVGVLEAGSGCGWRRVGGLSSFCIRIGTTDGQKPETQTGNESQTASTENLAASAHLWMPQLAQ